MCGNAATVGVLLFRTGALVVHPVDTAAAVIVMLSKFKPVDT